MFDGIAVTIASLHAGQPLHHPPNASPSPCMSLVVLGTSSLVYVRIYKQNPCRNNVLHRRAHAVLVPFVTSNTTVIPMTVNAYCL